MANELMNFTNALFGTISTVSNVVDDWTHKKAKLAVDNMQINLQMDVNKKLNELALTGDYTKWNDEIIKFYDQIKGMTSEPGSPDRPNPYYCESNLQAEMFNEILSDSLARGVNQVNRMVLQKQISQIKVDTFNSIDNVDQMGIYGQEGYETKRQLFDNLDSTIGVDPQEYDAYNKQIFSNSRNQTVRKLYNDNLQQAINDEISPDEFITKVFDNLPAMELKDKSGKIIAFDTTADDDRLKNEIKQEYNARIKTVQQQNETKLSELVKKMDDQTTPEGKRNAALYGRSQMDGMKGWNLTPSARLHYSQLFKLGEEGSFAETSGSGNSSEPKPTDAFKDLMTYSGSTVLELYKSGKYNLNQATGMLSEEMANQWKTGFYKENHGKNEAELNEEWELLYKGKSSQNNLLNAVIDDVVKMYPDIADLLKSDCKKLKDEIDKNPKIYSADSLEKLSHFLLDTVAESKYGTDEKLLLEKFEKYKNDCYIDSIDALEFKKDNVLKKYYNPDKPADIAEAAKIVNERDFVYTYNDTDVWANGKKEALEAKDGIIDVLKKGMANTLGIDESEIHWRYTATKDDKTSTPIFNYNSVDYKIVPDGKNGYKVVNMVTGLAIKGLSKKEAKANAKAGAKAAAQARSEEKKELHQNTLDAQAKKEQLTQDRFDKYDDKLRNGKVPDLVLKMLPNSKKDIQKTWDNSQNLNDGNVLYDRYQYLQETKKRVNELAASVKKGKLKPEDFETKTGIPYAKWNPNGDDVVLMNLILEN